MINFFFQYWRRWNGVLNFSSFSVLIFLVRVAIFFLFVSLFLAGSFHRSRGFRASRAIWNFPPFLSFCLSLSSSYYPERKIEEEKMKSVDSFSYFSSWSNSLLAFLTARMATFPFPSFWYSLPSPLPLPPHLYCRTLIDSIHIFSWYNYTDLLPEMLNCL